MIISFFFIRKKQQNNNVDDLKNDELNTVEDYTLKVDELNFGNYKQVECIDLIPALTMFWSFLKHKQIILFIFYTAE